MTTTKRKQRTLTKPARAFVIIRRGEMLRFDHNAFPALFPSAASARVWAEPGERIARVEIKEIEK